MTIKQLFYSLQSAFTLGSVQKGCYFLTAVVWVRGCRAFLKLLGKQESADDDLPHRPFLFC